MIEVVGIVSQSFIVTASWG